MSQQQLVACELRGSDWQAPGSLALLLLHLRARPGSIGHRRVVNWQGSSKGFQLPSVSAAKIRGCR
eukprot:750632-Hanusia_phi.AAC.2